MNTSTRRNNGNISFRDEDYSPGLGESMWEDAPLLAALQDPSIGHLYMNHFHDYVAADWTITTTETGAGTATEALTDEAGGVLLITNDDGDNESDEFQKVGEAYQLLPGKPCWAEFKLKVSDATQSDFLCGLCITDTTLIDGMSDGVYFLKDDGDENIDYHCIKDTTETGSNGDTGIDVVAATYNRFGIKFDGAGNVEYWIDGVKVATATANIPDDELLTISFAIQNGVAAAKTMSLDYIKVFQLF